MSDRIVNINLSKIWRFIKSALYVIFGFNWIIFLCGSGILFIFSALDNIYPSHTSVLGSLGKFGLMGFALSGFASALFTLVILLRYNLRKSVVTN